MAIPPGVTSFLRLSILFFGKYSEDAGESQQPVKYPGFDYRRSGRDEALQAGVRPVGWVEPTGRANARPMTGSAKPISSVVADTEAMGFTAFNPSYEP
jgi:hypothetical protein